jgi:predicted CoA-binding protein
MPIQADAKMERVLDDETIAVVGCSTSPGKAAHDIPKYLLDHEYEVIPINPFAEEVLGRRAYDSLGDVPGTVDVVNVFRPSEEVPGIVDETLELADIQAIWLQLGISHDEAANRAEAAGLAVVQDKCIKIEHRRLC